MYDVMMMMVMMMMILYMRVMLIINGPMLMLLTWTIMYDYEVDHDVW